MTLARMRRLFVFIVYLCAIPGLPSLISSLNFPCCVSIAGDQRLSFIWHTVATGAGHGTILQPAVWGIHGKDGEYSGTYNAAMHLGYIYIFRLGHD